jgi:mannosyl-3-phosphoglycerate synthase
VNIQTVQFAHILENRDLETLHDFLSQTAFVISHKNESIETLLRVLWYIPVNSTIIVVTNCPEQERDELTSTLKTRLADHRKTYLLHQKDERIARLFQAVGVSSILGTDGRIANGKGEGMYIGALCAYQLGYPRWLIFYDADNFVPSALLEYTLAMGRLFMSTSMPVSRYGGDTLFVQRQTDRQLRPDLHNVRICWASKPELGSENWQAGIMGRTTKVVSPLFESLLEGWFGISNHPISSSNAGEQGMTVRTASTLRFSSGFSVETFQLLDLLFNASPWKEHPEEIVFQQYLSQSPHFHEKKGDEHIKKMIEESLGCFFYFDAILPKKVKRQLQRVYDELQLEHVSPVVYPCLQNLPLEPFAAFFHEYALFPVHELLRPIATGTIYLDLLTTGTNYEESMTGDAVCQDILLPDTGKQEAVVAEANLQEILAADPECQNFLVSDAPYQNLPLAD